MDPPAVQGALVTAVCRTVGSRVSTVHAGQEMKQLKGPDKYHLDPSHLL